MLEWLKKHKGAVMVGTYVASCATLVSTYVISVIRGDKRQIKSYEKLNEVYDAELKALRGEKE